MKTDISSKQNIYNYDIYTATSNLQHYIKIYHPFLQQYNNLHKKKFLVKETSSFQHAECDFLFTTGLKFNCNTIEGKP